MNSLTPRKFGIELEISRRFVNIAYSDRKKSGAWLELQESLARLNRNGLISRGWRLKTDTSCGGELVSPPMFAPAGLIEVGHVAQMTKKLAKHVGRPVVDGECGLHLHFDASDMTPRTLSNLFIILHMAEPIIFAMYPARNFNYCAPIDVNMKLAKRFRDWVDVRDTWYRPSNNVKDKSATYTDSFISSTSSGDLYDGTRYHGFNIHCFWKLGTVEFRYGTGTFDLMHIKAYYEMCLAMMNTAMNTKRIKPSDGIINKKYGELTEYYNTNYRGRKYISELCKMCGFSRSTIKLIMSLIKANNPGFIEKDPSLVPTCITKSNAMNYHFLDVSSGTYFDWNGTVTNGPYGDERVGATRPDGTRYIKYKNPKRVINVDVTSDYNIVSLDANVSLEFKIKLNNAFKKHLSQVKIVRNRNAPGSYYYDLPPVNEVALEAGLPLPQWNGQLAGDEHLVEAQQVVDDEEDLVDF